MPQNKATNLHDEHSSKPANPVILVVINLLRNASWRSVDDGKIIFAEE